MRLGTRPATGVWVAALFACLAPAAAAVDDWIGLDDGPPILLGVDAGQDGNGDALTSLLIDAPFDDRSGFAGYYSSTEIRAGEQRFDSHGLVSSIWLQVNHLLDIELSHFFDGNSDELEREALGLAFDLKLGEWRLGIDLQSGETRIFTRDVGVEPIDNRVPEFIESDLDGQGIAIGWRGIEWYWRLGFQQTDYARDLGGLASSRLLQQIVSASALAQSGLLVSERATLILAHIGLADELSLTLASDRSAIDDSEADTLGPVVVALGRRRVRLPAVGDDGLAGG